MNAEFAEKKDGGLFFLFKNIPITFLENVFWTLDRFADFSEMYVRPYDL